MEQKWDADSDFLVLIIAQNEKGPLAPAEWKYPLHHGALPPADDAELSKYQTALTLHIYNTLQALLQRLFLEHGDALAEMGIEKIDHWCMRFEFQKRGTIHVHVVCWLQMLPGHQSRHAVPHGLRMKQWPEQCKVNQNTQLHLCTGSAYQYEK